uniref:Myosin_tail_1 domain-containing protein n=1 Tax=Syphacia muris TaxID=451379 RepID=A0A0N5AB70_9BILA
MESVTSHRKRPNGYRHHHSSHDFPNYDRHKSSHKRRRHKSRSRSLSGSLSGQERKQPVVYMNPAFQQVYGSTSMLATQSEVEMRSTLVNQLSACEQRISSLESELRAAQLARGRAEQAVFEVNAEKLRIESHNSEIVQVMKTLERAVEALQKQLKGITDESERRQLEFESIEKNLALSREQNNFLSERNVKLVKKCEDLATENKAILNRRDESARELSDMRSRIEALQSELRSRADDNRKLNIEMRGFEEKERSWKKEKADLEKRIEIKDAVATAERKNNDEWKKRHLAEKAELERKVKLAEPEINRALSAVTESIKKAVEDIRAFYEQKLSYLLDELEAIKKKCSIKEADYTSTASSSNQRLDLEKCGHDTEVDYRPSSAPPASLVPSNHITTSKS